MPSNPNISGVVASPPPPLLLQPPQPADAGPPDAELAEQVTETLSTLALLMVPAPFVTEQV